tara:strand:- start:630 stop:2825 length:2196 start_codon:yes stop_codon:yes gene_type:complete
MYAKIVFPIASFQSFIYKIPKEFQDNINIGSAVNVSFRNKMNVGHVESILPKSPFSGKIHSIKSICHTQSISIDLWKIIIWMSNYYVTPIGLCIKSAFPSIHSQLTTNKKNLYIQINKSKKRSIKEKNFSKNQQLIIDKLLTSNKPIAIKDLKLLISNIYDVIKKLSALGIIIKTYQDDDLDSFNLIPSQLNLSKAQLKVYQKIKSYIGKNQYKGFLIHGIPGSGKTEIYIKLAQETIKKGKNVIILIPEIILTTQMKDRFLKYFGNSVAVWHSKMTSSEKKKTLKKIDNNQYKIIIGARSSIFTPLCNIGLIVIDEEQDSSYKQESPKPYYNARDVGFMRALHTKCPILLTSATPSLESYYNSIMNKIQILNLDETYYKSKSPNIEVVNMMDYFSNNSPQTIISPLLLQKIRNTISNHGQCIILNNRRGYATSVISQSTKNPISCDFCDVPMSYHKSNNKLLCHYCDSSKVMDQISDKDNNQIILNGYGTEKIKEVLQSYFPGLSIQRLDSDTLRKKDTLKSTLLDFQKGKINILIGTQMLSKGLDFDNVHLVGVINADYGMFMPDFRSGEKTFQIISQVIGRSGRRERQGLAIIQTYNPDNPNLLHAIQSNYQTFYAQTLAERNELSYPPFTRLCRITFSSNNIDDVNNVSNKITNIFKNSNQFKVLGPAESPISKIRNQWRMNSLIIANKKNPLAIQRFFNLNIGTHILEKAYNNVTIKLDIDPLSML